MVLCWKKKNSFEFLTIIALGFIVIYQAYIIYGHSYDFFFKNLDGQLLGGFTIKDIFYWDYGFSGRQFMPRPALFPNLLVQAAVVPLGFNHFLSNMIFSMLLMLITFCSFFLLFYQAAGPGVTSRQGLESPAGEAAPHGAPE